jgi:hypothetical protein
LAIDDAFHVLVSSLATRLTTLPERLKRFSLSSSVLYIHSACPRLKILSSLSFVESSGSHYPSARGSRAPQHNNSIPEPNMPYLQCCCGKLECAYLEHNNAALSGLEKDVETAARLGQVHTKIFPNFAYAGPAPQPLHPRFGTKTQGSLPLELCHSVAQMKR